MRFTLRSTLLYYGQLLYPHLYPAPSLFLFWSLHVIFMYLLSSYNWLYSVMRNNKATKNFNCIFYFYLMETFNHLPLWPKRALRETNMNLSTILLECLTRELFCSPYWSHPMSGVILCWLRVQQLSIALFNLLYFSLQDWLNITVQVKNRSHSSII